MSIRVGSYLHCSSVKHKPSEPPRLLLGITYPPFSHLHAASLILPAVAESVLLRYFRYGS